MKPDEAIKILEQFAESAMANGVIKNFATLDKIRDAIFALKKEVESKE